MPSVEIEVSSDNTVSRIIVEWYLFSVAANTFEIVHDQSILEQKVQDIFVALGDSDGYAGNGNQGFDDYERDWTVNGGVPEREWLFHGDSSMDNPVLDGFR